MTQKEFEQTKEWVENNTGLEFIDDQALYDKDGAYFEKAIDSDKRVKLCIDNDRSAELWMLFNDDSCVEIFTSSSQNNWRCLRVFAHIVTYN
jgi:hypothetical protein